MAVLYVDDGGNDSDGSSWANAFVAIDNAAILAAAAGSTIYIGSDHQENKGSTYTLAFPNGTLASPITIITADITSGEPPSTYESMVDGGGHIQTTGGTEDLSISGNMRVYGLKFDVQDKGSITTALGSIYTDCFFDFNDDLQFNVLAYRRLKFVSCTFLTPNDVIALNATSDSDITFCDCGLTTGGASFFTAMDPGQRLNIVDSDLSNKQTIVADILWGRSEVMVRRCLLHVDTLTDPIAASVILYPNSWIQIESSAAGTDTVPVAGLNLFIGYYGRIEHDEVEYRTGGASDGETPYSWKMTCNANTVSGRTALKTPPITAWKDASNQTLTVYVAHDAVGDGAAGDLQDDECWLEISSPDETDATTARGRFQTTLPATVLTAVADLTNEGSDEWQNTPTTFQQITATIDTSLAEAGPIVVRVALATGASSIVWIDPKLHFS